MASDVSCNNSRIAQYKAVAGASRERSSASTWPPEFAHRPSKLLGPSCLTLLFLFPGFYRTAIVAHVSPCGGNQSERQPLELYGRHWAGIAPTLQNHAQLHYFSIYVVQCSSFRSGSHLGCVATIHGKIQSWISTLLSTEGSPPACESCAFA